jgi:hypothetical protein
MDNITGSGFLRGDLWIRQRHKGAEAIYNVCIRKSQIKSRRPLFVCVCVCIILWFLLVFNEKAAPPSAQSDPVFFAAAVFLLLFFIPYPRSLSLPTTTNQLSLSLHSLLALLLQTKKNYLKKRTNNTLSLP